MKNVTTDLGANNLVGDGATDNLAHLNSAMTAWVVSDGAWFWPAGTYILSAKPSVIPNNMVWYGEGMTLTVIKGTRAAPSSTPVLDLSSAQNVTLRDMHITTTDDVNSAQQCIDCTSSVNLFCHRVKMSNGYSAGMRTSTKSVGMRFIGGEVTNFHQEPSCSGFSGDFSDSLIAHSYFHHQNTVQVTTQHYIYINGTTQPRNTTILGCVFTTFNGGPVDFAGGFTPTTAALNLQIIGCTFDGTDSIANSCITMKGCIAPKVLDCGFFLTNSVVGSMNGISPFGSNLVNYIIDGNTCTFNDPTYNGAFIAIGGGLAGSILLGGKICNNTISNLNGQISDVRGIYAISANGLEIHNNTFNGLYAGVMLSSGTAGNVKNVYIHDNFMRNDVGATNNGQSYNLGLPNGKTAGVILDGTMSGIRMRNNVVTGVDYEVAFTTNNSNLLDTSGNADNTWLSVNPEGSVVVYVNGAKPTNFSWQRYQERPP